MKFSVCTDALFSGMDFSEAAHLARSSGAEAIEFWGWWDKDISLVESSLCAEGLALRALCTRFIPLNDSSLRKAYLAGLSETLEAADKLGAKVIISQVGDDLGIEREIQHYSIVEGLIEASDILKSSKIKLAIEPLNTVRDHRGYYLSNSSEGFDIIREVKSESISLLYDIYHQSLMGEDILSSLIPNIKNVCHLHAAGTDSRAELHLGKTDYRAIFARLDEIGYTGYCGLEYFPEGSAEESLRAILNRK